MAKPKADYVVGVDLGGTKILAAVVDTQGNIVGRSKRKTLPSAAINPDPPLVADRIAVTVQEAVAAAKLSMARVKAVGASAPGPVNVDTGWVYKAANLPGWHNGYDLGPELSKRLQVPVVVDNDVNLGTLGEAVYGAGQGYADLIGIFVGTGIGGGLILGGTLRRGFRWAAGEIGHMTVAKGGPLCGCGERGHVEAIASRGAISRRLGEAIAAGEPTALMVKEGGVIASGEIRKALDASDPLTQRVLLESEETLGIFIASLVNLLDPQCVVLGGGLVESLGQPYVTAVAEHAYAHFFLKDDMDKVKIVQAGLGDNATVLGASVLARNLKANI